MHSATVRGALYLLVAATTLTSALAQQRGTPPQSGPSAVSGRITDADGKPVAGIEVRTMRWIGREDEGVLANFGPPTKTDQDGRYRLDGRLPGPYLIVAAADPVSSLVTTRSQMPPPIAQPDGTRLAYFPTFYPGTRSGPKATPVEVGDGDKTGVDFVLVRAQAFEITGAVSGSRASFITLVPQHPLDSVDTRRIRPGPGGEFTIPDVGSGEYELMTSSPAGWARATVRITDRAPDAVTLATQPYLRVSGRVEFRGTQPLPSAAELQKPGGFSVMLRPAVMRPGTSMIATPISADGQFSVSAPGAGLYSLQVRGATKWIQESGIVNGQDTIDLPIEIAADVSDAAVVVVDRLAPVLGHVKDERGNAAVNAVAIVFSEDPRYWTRTSRRVQLISVTPGGTFIASGMPSGRYRAFVSADLRADEPITPSLLESLSPKATSFVVESGKPLTLQLTLGRRQ